MKIKIPYQYSRIVSLLLLFTGGCVPFHIVNLSSTALPSRTTNAAFASPTRDHKDIYTNTPHPKTPVPTREPTLEPPPVKTQQMHDTEIAPIPSCREDGLPVQPTESFGLDYVLAYYDGELGGFYTVGGDPLVYSQIPLSNTKVTDWAGFSPDGKWLAYAPFSPKIVLLSSKGEITESLLEISGFFTQIPEGSSLSGWGNHEWINNNLVLLNIAYRESEQTMTNTQLMAVLDPFMGVWRNDLIAELPNRYEYSGAVYSPDMTRVLYVVEKMGDVPTVLVLWDRSNQSLIWENQLFDHSLLAYEGVRTAARYSEWSLDSSTVAYVGPEDPNSATPEASQRGVYLLNRDGGESQLITNFMEDFDSFNSYGFRWSPDSRYLAFITNLDRDEVQHQLLFVFDSISEIFIFQCPLYEDEIEDYASIYWSPDSRYIAYSYNHLSPLAVIELETGLVFKLAEKTIISGWSDKFPTVLSENK